MGEITHPVVISRIPTLGKVSDGLRDGFALMLPGVRPGRFLPRAGHFPVERGLRFV